MPSTKLPMIYVTENRLKSRHLHHLRRVHLRFHLHPLIVKPRHLHRLRRIRLRLHPLIVRTSTTFVELRILISMPGTDASVSKVPVIFSLYGTQVLRSISVSNLGKTITSVSFSRLPWQSMPTPSCKLTVTEPSISTAYLNESNRHRLDLTHSPPNQPPSLSGFLIGNPFASLPGNHYT